MKAEDIMAKYQEFTVMNSEAANALIDNYVLIPLMNNQREAIVSFASSVGGYPFYRSKLLTHVNNGEFLKAADQFTEWVMHEGKRKQRLVKRRETEKALFLRPEIVKGG